jgi:hypothetical protein
VTQEMHLGVLAAIAEVRTKFSKSLTRCFFPVGEGICGIVAQWVAEGGSICIRAIAGRDRAETSFVPRFP